MKTISFLNLKGGPGKTLSAANFAHILATIHGKRVLLVDADKQGNASQYFRLYDGERAGTAALMMNPALDILETIYKTEYSGLDCITSNMELYAADRAVYDDTERDTASVLKSALRPVQGDYDYCVIDNGPAIDTVVLNVLVASDDVLIPVRPDEFSISGLLDLTEQISGVKSLNPALNLRGCFFTHWQNREKFAEVRESLVNSGICPVFKTTINYNPVISESTIEGKPLCAYARRSWAAIQYVKLVNEYLGM